MGKKLKTNDFIEKANKIHNGKYDYSLVNYRKGNFKIKIICPIHGEFEQIPSGHLRGAGCKKCQYESISKKQTYTKIDFITKANKIHNGKYDYSQINYVNSQTKVKIICPIHGEFEQIAGNHLNGSGCIKCKHDYISKKYSYDNDKFINKANEIHEGKYDYSLVDYKRSLDVVKIICPIHGEFEQRPDSHLSGAGCPKCNNKISSYEQEITKFIVEELNIEVENNKRLLDGKEIDILIPEYGIGVECNGIYWHSELKGKDKNYHLSKLKSAQSKNIQLIHIWDLEWKIKKDIVKSIIRNKLGKNDRIIYARKCEVKKVYSKHKKQFLNDNHLQGDCRSSINLGLFYKNELISLMAFDKRKITKKTSFELLRFCNLIKTTVVGGCSKLFEHFIKNYKVENEIISYADKRYSCGKIYDILGFTFSHDSKPNYWYFSNNRKLYHRSNFMKHKLKDKLEIFDPNLTEWQNMQINGYDRIWDCGNMVFKYKGIK